MNTGIFAAAMAELAANPTRTAKTNAYPFADGIYAFRLGIGQLVELQEKCKAGPPEVYTRLGQIPGRWMVEDVRETIRLGLIGADVKPEKALSLVTRYVDERLGDYAPLAFLIIGTALFSPEDEETPGKPQGETMEETPADSPDSNSPTSTEAAL